MRTLLCAAVCLVAGVIVSGCGCGMNAPSGNSAVVQAENANAYLMKSNGVSVLKVTPPTHIKCVSSDGLLHFTAPQYEVEFWLVPDVQTVDEATTRIRTQIVDEFKDFKAEHTTDLIIANAPAKRLVGSGHEADDDDPGDADVIVFKVGEHVFIACNHGESLTPAGQQGLLTLVQTAQIP